MTIFKGAATALITPFVDDKVDFSSLERLVDYQLKGGINALVINGTTGEPTTMMHRERTEVAKFVIKKVNGKIPVILGAGSNNTFTAVEYAVEAEELGADGILAVTPYYNKCTQQGIIGHYEKMASSVGIPIIMYNVPGRTGVNISAETMLRLSDVKNIQAIKEASGNINQFMEVTRLVRGKLDIYSGDDALVYPIMALGGAGVISVASNIAPKFMADIANDYLNGNHIKSLDSQLKINPLVHMLFAEVNPIPVKCAARILGLIKDDYMRLPLTKFSMEDKMRVELKNFGFDI